MEEENISKWKLLKEYFQEQFQSPLKHPEFIIYFLIVIVGVGAIGIWTTVYIENKISTTPNNWNIVLSIIGYALPIISTGAVDLIFTQEKYIKNSIRLIGFSSVLVVITLFIICFTCKAELGIYMSILGVVLSWSIWWIANAGNANLNDNSYFEDRSNDVKKLGEGLTDLENESK